MIARLLQPLQPPLSPPAAGRDLALEGLRGSCAALVCYAHLFLPIRVLDPRWAPSPRFSWFNLGYPAVLVFFVLSGYVIGLVTMRPATVPGIRQYALHRVARLLPLNTLTVLICVLLVHPGWRTAAANLLFLQNDEPYPGLGLLPVLANNPNLWSLNYEVVFYLGFIALWFRPLRSGPIFGGLLLVIWAHATGLPVPRMIARFACGAIFWLAGLTVAWMTPPAGLSDRRSNWPAAALTAYALWTFAPLRTLLIHWNLAAWVWPSPTPMSPHRLDFLPACVWLLLAVTARAPHAQRWLGWSCLALAATGLAGRVLAANWQEVDSVAAAALLGALATRRWQCSLRPLQKLAPLGGVSFALYAIAAPLQLGQRAFLPGFSGSGLTFAVRLMAVIAGVGVSAWLLERRLCPPIGRWIRRLGDQGA